MHADALLETEVAHDGLDVWPIGSVAVDLEPQIGPLSLRRGESAHERRHALLRHVPPGIHDERRITSPRSTAGRSQNAGWSSSGSIATSGRSRPATARPLRRSRCETTRPGTVIVSRSFTTP